MWEGVESVPDGVSAYTLLHEVFLNQEWLLQYHKAQEHKNIRISLDEPIGVITVAFVTPSALMGDVRVEETMRYSLHTPHHLSVTCVAKLEGSGPVSRLHPTYRWEVLNGNLNMKLDIVFVSVFFFCFCFLFPSHSRAKQKPEGYADRFISSTVISSALAAGQKQMLYWWGEAKRAAIAARNKPEVQRTLAFDDDELTSPGDEVPRVSSLSASSSDNDSEDGDMVFEDAQKEVSVSDYGIVQALLQVAQRSVDTLKRDFQTLQERRLCLEGCMEEDESSTSNKLTVTPGRVGLKFVRFLNREEHSFSRTTGESSGSSWLACSRASRELLLRVKRMSVWRLFLAPVFVPWAICAVIAIAFAMRRRLRSR